MSHPAVIAVFVHSERFAPVGRVLVGFVFLSHSRCCWFALLACFVLILACISVDAVLFVVPVVFLDVVLIVVEKNDTRNSF